MRVPGFGYEVEVEGARVAYAGVPLKWILWPDMSVVAVPRERPAVESAKSERLESALLFFSKRAGVSAARAVPRSITRCVPSPARMMFPGCQGPTHVTLQIPSPYQTLDPLR